MPKTTLQIINSTLALIGEQPLLSSLGNLGDLTRDAINTALVNVAQETRANIFETTIQVNATNNDYLVPALTLPATVLQVFTVSLRQSTGSSFGDNLIQLEYLPLEAITSEPSYSLSGSNLYLSPTIGRPATVFLRALQSFSLPTSDVTDSGLPDVVIPAVQHVAASILALSYLDDPNQAAIQQRIAQSLLDKLKSQYGVSRAKAFNVSGQRRTAGFGSGGVSNISGAVQYAPLNSPALTGNPTAPTPEAGDNDTSIATTAFVQGDTSWTNATLQNSWTNFGGGFASASFLKTGIGSVFIRGLVSKGTTPINGEVIFTLPTGYRPSNTLIFTLGTFSSTGAFTIARIDVEAGGNVVWKFFTPDIPGASVNYLSLNINFSNKA